MALSKQEQLDLLKIIIQRGTDEYFSKGIRDALTNGFQFIYDAATEEVADENGFYNSIEDRDNYFSVNFPDLLTDDIIAVNTGGEARFQQWTGDDGPASYDNSLWGDTEFYASTLNTDPGSVILGNLRIDSANHTIAVENLSTGVRAIGIAQIVNTSGSETPFTLNIGSESIVDRQLLFGEGQPSVPYSFSYTYGPSDNIWWNGLVLRPEEAGDFQFEVRANDASGELITYQDDFTFLPGDIGNDTTIRLSNSFSIYQNETIYVTISGAKILGGTPVATWEPYWKALEQEIISFDPVAGPDATEQAARHQITGILEGGIISEATTTTVDWTSGHGLVADYSDPESPVITNVTWDAVSGQSITNIATDGTTVFGYDSTGSVVEKLINAIEIEDAHSTIWFGSVNHLSGSITSVMAAPGNIGYDGIGSFSDFINLVIGPANIDGNVYAPNGDNMTIDVLGGNAFMLASNFRNDPKISDIVTLPSDTALSFQKLYRSAGVGLNMIFDGAVTTIIDPSQYDDGSGTLATTTAGYWSIQRIFRHRTGETFIAYGQQEFSTKELALEALGSESFLEKSPLPFMLYRCSLAVKQGASELDDTDEAEFFAESSFRIGGAQSATATIPGVTSPGGSEGSVQFNSSNTFGGDSNFVYDSVTRTLTIKAPISGTGASTIELLNSLGSPKGVLEYDESADELAVKATGTTSEVHLNDAAFVHRGTIDGRIDIHSITNAGCALLTLSNFAGGTGLSLEHDDATDESIIDSEIGDLTIQTTTASTDVNINPTGKLNVGSEINISDTTKGFEIDDIVVLYSHADDYNTMVGQGALISLTSGEENIAIGVDALTSTTDGASNIAIGYTAGYSNIGGIDNVAIGSESFYSNTTGDNNTAVGTNTLYANTTGDNNTAIGRGSLSGNVAGDMNTSIGSLAGNTIVSADGTGANTIVGYSTGLGITTGVNNTIIGANVTGLGTTLSNNIILADGAGNRRINVDNNGRVGININDPDSVLHIYEDTTETGIQAGLTIEQDGTGDAITQYLLSGGQRWVTGLDNSGGDAFKIASSLDLASNAQLVLETDGRSEFVGKLGVNKLPTSIFHIYEDSSNIDATAGLTIEQDGTGDALVQFLLTGGQRWVAGIDNSSTGDDFGISGRGSLGGSTSNFTLDDTQGLILKNDSSATGVFDTPSGIRLDNIDDTDGNFTSIVNYGFVNISSGIAFVNDDYSANIGHIEFGIRGAGGFTHALTLQEGNYGNVNSTNLIFNKGDEGADSSEFVLFNDSNPTEFTRYFRMSYADEITTKGGLNISDANNFVSIGTRTDPDSVLHIYEDTTETGDQAGLTIEQDGTGDAITQYLLSGGQRWVTGIDNSGSDAYKIASSINLGTNDQLVLQTNGQSEFVGKLGVNKLPTSIFHIYEDTTETGANAGLTIEQDGTGDAVAQFLVTGGQRWVMGIDNSQDDEFCISSTLDLNSNKRVVLQTDGRNYFLGTLGVGQVPESGYRLDVLTSISVHTRLSTFKAVTIEAGKNGSGNSTDLFFNRGNVGFNQSEFAMYNENSSTGSLRYFRMGYSADIDTSGGLTVWKTRNNVVAGSYTQPDSVFTVSENTTETGDQAGLTIIQEGTGDAIAQFLLDGGQRWVMGIDNSASDAFKIASSINLGTNDMFVLSHTAGAFLYSNTDNVLTLGNSTGETSKISVDNAGSPEGVVTGTGGDLHVNSNGVSSRMALKKSAGSSTADWYDVALTPPVEKVIYNTAELEAMATFGVITVSSSTTWKIKGHLDSDTEIVLANRAQLHIVTDNSNQASWTYSGTGTFLSGTGGFRSLEFFDILSSSTGTFTNLDLDGRSMNLTLCGLFLWDDLGSLSNGTFILDVSDLFENDLGFDFTNMKITITQSNISDNEIGSTPFFDVDNSFVGAKSISVNQLSGSFNAGSSLFRIQPALDITGKADISGCIFTGGQLFDTSGATGEFTVVADASVPTETITSVSDSSGVARFNFSAPPTLFVNQEVVISGYGTRTSFNGTHIITATGAGYFEVASIDYEAGVDSGSFISNSVTMTDTGTTLSDGDQITICTTNSTDYDGGAIVYNQLTNTFQINKTWGATESGTWSQAGLDQSDARVVAHDNPDYADSRYLAFGHIEENPLVNTTVIGSADTYQAPNLTGTTGSITVFATNGAGGTTCTSTTHGLVENQNVVLTAGDTYYRGAYTIFNVLTNTFDIAKTFQTTVLTSTWTSGVNSDSERFKIVDPSIAKFTYIGHEPFDGFVTVTWSVYKTGNAEDYIFSAGKNGVSPEQGAPYQKRTVTTSTSVHPVTIPVNLVEGDTVQPILASVTTTNSITVENLQIEVS